MIAMYRWVNLKKFTLIGEPKILKTFILYRAD